MATISQTATYTGSKSGTQLSAKITTTQGGVTLVTDFGCSGSYNSGNSCEDLIKAQVMQQVAGGSTSGSITVSVT